MSIADDLRVIFRAENTERIVSVVQYRDRVLIATDRRILEWNSDAGTISVLEFVTLSPSDAPAIVAAYHKAHPHGV